MTLRVKNTNWQWQLHTCSLCTTWTGLDLFIPIAEGQRLHPATLVLNTLSYGVLSSLWCLLGLISYLVLLIRPQRIAVHRLSILKMTKVFV